MLSDLQTTEPIDFRRIECFNSDCGKPFNIKSDRVGPAYRYLIFDCYELLKQKRYMYCILNLAQSFEAFFAFYIQIKLLYEPSKNRLTESIEDFDNISLMLYQKVKEFPYMKLRNIFFHTVLTNNTIYNSKKEVKDEIENLGNITNTPSNDMLRTIHDSELGKLLIKLKNTDINEIRNKVVHQNAYRPSLQEVERCLEETREIVFGLTSRLRIRHPSFYF